MFCAWICMIVEFYTRVTSLKAPSRVQCCICDPHPAVAGRNCIHVEHVMTETAKHILINGEPCPDLSLPSVSHGTVSLSEYTKGAWSVVLFYRGNWCPFCNAQLNAFQRKLS